MAQKTKKLVILDLDETLIHSRIEKLDRDPEIEIEPLNVYVRPFAIELVNELSKRFEIAVWSAGSQQYVETISNHLINDEIEPVFVWDRQSCSRKSSFFSFHEVFTKDLSKVESFGFALSSVLIIEDDPVKIADHRDNAIIVSQYFGDANDNELEQLAKYLDHIDTVDDIRELDKNIWCFKTNSDK